MKATIQPSENARVVATGIPGIIHIGYWVELIHCIHFGDTAQACGFKVTAKTEEEVMEHAKLHEKEAHGKELSP